MARNTEIILAPIAAPRRAAAAPAKSRAVTVGAMAAGAVTGTTLQVLASRGLGISGLTTSVTLGIPSALTAFLADGPVAAAAAGSTMAALGQLTLQAIQALKQRLEKKKLEELAAQAAAAHQLPAAPAKRNEIPQEVFDAAVAQAVAQLQRNAAASQQQQMDAYRQMIAQQQQAQAQQYAQAQAAQYAHAIAQQYAQAQQQQAAPAAAKA